MATIEDDARTEIRLFLASSEELEEERRGFAAALAEIGERPDLRRDFVLTPVRWETDAYGFSEDIDETIRSTVEFDRLNVVIVVVWNRLGEGTLAEYEAALALERFRGRPRLAVFVREPPAAADGEGSGLGFYESPWGSKHPRLQLLTVHDLLDGRTVDRPRTEAAAATFKRAPKAKGKGDEQLGLGE